MLKKVAKLFTFLLFISTHVYSQQTTNEDIITSNKKKDSFFNRLIHGNIDRTREKRFDISFISAPSYTREANFGIGGMASGLYRMDRQDSIMPPSDITLTFNASVLGFYAIGAKGNNYFKGNRSVLAYKVEFTSKPLDFWGISYDSCAVSPVITHTRQQIEIDANYQYKVLKNFYVGGTLDFRYTDISKIDDIAYLQGQKKSYIATGLGLSLQYDSRDFIPNPQQGIYLMLRQSIFPGMLGNTNKTMHRTTFITDTYQSFWNGGVFAFDFFGQLNGNDAPWPLKEMLGGNQRMRGYYAGRYIDNNIVSSQIELRQHLIQRFGGVAWLGGGTVFPSFNKFKMRNLLPTYGIGLRWEFKHNVNARIDYGFGKQTGGFVFNIGEAF